jgi:multidrug resistance efflux pump
MRPRRRAPWVILAAATALIPIAAAAWWLNPFAETGVPGIVSAPKVSIMAPADGRVSQIMVSNGSRVQPTTDLLVIDAPPPDERKRAELAARLQNAHARADRLDKQIAEMNGILDDLRSRPPDPTGTRQQSEVRLRLIDMKAQKDTATSEARELEQNLANDAARPHGPQTVKAGIDGMVWSIATSDGAEAARGIPLMELADCSHITITLGNRGDAATGLLPGSTVKARIGGGGPLLSGILRLGRGSMTRGESTDTAAGQGVRDAGLQVELNPGELAKLGAASCPVGKPVAIYPE